MVGAQNIHADYLPDFISLASTSRNLSWLNSPVSRDLSPQHDRVSHLTISMKLIECSRANTKLTFSAEVTSLLRM